MTHTYTMSITMRYIQANDYTPSVMNQILQEEFTLPQESDHVLDSFLVNLIKLIGHYRIVTNQQSQTEEPSPISMELRHVIHIVQQIHARDDGKAIQPGKYNPSLLDLKKHTKEGGIIQIAADDHPYGDQEHHTPCTYTPTPLYLNPPGYPAVVPCVKTHLVKVSKSRSNHCLD